MYTPSYNPYANLVNQNYNIPSQNAFNNLMQQYQQYQQPQSMQQPQINMQQQSQPQNLFLQPSGSLYNIDNIDQLSNVPVQEGQVSCVIFASANMVYLKTLQGGKPVLLNYNLTNTEPKPAKQEEVVADKPVKKEEFEHKTNENINILSDNTVKLWKEIEDLKKKLGEIYSQLGVESTDV